MRDISGDLTHALADGYRLERELGQGGMAAEPVTEVTARLMSLKRQVPGLRGHFSDLSRVAALAADSGADPAADPKLNPNA